MNIHFTTNIRQWFLLLVCLMCTLPSCAEDYKKNGIVYGLNTSKNTAWVKGSESKYISIANIKSIVEGCNVTSIGVSAFQGCTSLTSITIPNTVTSIGRSAFQDCIYNHRTTKTNQKYPSVNL